MLCCCFYKWIPEIHDKKYRENNNIKSLKKTISTNRTEKDSIWRGCTDIEDHKNASIQTLSCFSRKLVNLYWPIRTSKTITRDVEVYRAHSISSQVPV